MSNILKNVNNDKICQILIDYYGDTYSQVFGRSIHLSNSLQKCCSLIFNQSPIKEFDLNSMFHLDDHERKKLMSFMKNIAPQEKILDLCEFHKVQSLLDFGCGNGYILQYMKKTYNIKTAIGLEIENKLQEKIEEKIGLQIFDDMNSISNEEILFDSVLIIHVFHHLNDNDIIKQFQKILPLLSKRSFIYVSEDYLGELGEEATSAYDKKYDLLTIEEKRRLLEINDFWSNIFIYHRNKAFQKNNFKTVDEWSTLFEKFGLKIKFIWKKGFNSKRLHGVPSIVFLLVRNESDIKII